MTIYRATASGIFASGEVWSFRQHFDSAALIGTFSGDWFAQITSFWTDGTHGVQTLYPTGTSVTLTSVAILSGVPFRETTKQTATAALPGTSVGDSMPEQDCVLVSLRGADVGKKNRGRIHLPALAETAATGGLIGSTESSRLSTAIGALYAGMRLLGHTPVVYNTKVSKVPTVDPVIQTMKVILTEEVDRVVRTQRRRTAGRRAIYV